MYRTRKTGTTDEYDLLRPIDLQETTTQKLRRLRIELSELDEEINKKESKNIAETPPKANLASLHKELDALQSNLDNLGAAHDANTGGKLNDTARLLKRLDEIKRAAMEEPGASAAPTTPSSSSAITYELMYTPSIPNDVSLAAIEQRLHSIESLIGPEHANAPDLQSTPQPSLPLLATIARLEHQISLLSQPRHLDTLAKRIKILTAETERAHEARSKDRELSEGRSSSPTRDTEGQSKLPTHTSLSTEQVERLENAFALMPKLEALIPLTPRVLDRLRSLQSVHRESTEMVAAVKDLTRQVEREEQKRTGLEEMLGKLDESVSANQQTVSSNMQIVEKRISDLLSRLEKL